MPRKTLLSIIAGLALAAAACGGGGKTQQDAAVQDDAGHQFDAVGAEGGAHDAGPDGPGGFEGAKSITVDSSTYTTGTLTDPLTSEDYYKFTGTAGQRIAVATVAKSGQTDPFDISYLDLVVTVYDSTQTAIATQDDPWPRESNDPELYTVLPTAGTYYVTVQECNKAFGSSVCAPAAGITHKSYQIGIFTVDNLGPPTPVVEGATDQDGTIGNAIPIVFTSSQTVDAGVGGNLYARDIIGGNLQSGTDVDVYSFKVPADYLILDATYRPTAVFWLQTPGMTNGNGSTARIKAWVVDADDTSHEMAEVDQANYSDTGDSTNSPAELNVPITLDHQYYLFVENREGTAGARDFYFIVRADDNYFGPNEPATAHDTLATAAVMATQKDADGSDWYGVSGNLATAGTSLGYYSMAVNTGMTLANVACDAERIGSGLRGFKATLLKADGTAIANGSITEAADSEMRLTDLPIPNTETTVILKLEAASQDANVTSTHYRCQIHLHG